MSLWSSRPKFCPPWLIGDVIPYQGEEQPQELPGDGYQGLGFLRVIGFGPSEIDGSEGPSGVDGLQRSKEQALPE